MTTEVTDERLPDIRPAPRRAALIAALLGRSVDPSERPYTGPRFNVAAAQAPGVYTGPKGPQMPDPRPADADRVQSDPVVERDPVSPHPAFDSPDAATRPAPAAPQPGVYTGPKGPAPSQYDLDAQRNRDLLTNLPVSTNSRLAGAGRLAAFDASREAQQSNSLGRVLGAAGGGFLSGLFNKRADEETIDRPQEIARAQAQLNLDAAAEKERGEREARAAETRLRNVNADYAAEKPWLEEQKRADAAAQRERTAVLANFCLRKGQPLDANNPQDRALLERAANAGVFIDPEEWNSSAGNNVTLTLTDPKDPTKTNTVIFNKVTQTPTVVGQKGFQQPVDTKTGMTPKQEADASLGGARLAEDARHHKVGEAQGQERLGQSFQLGVARLEQGDVRLAQSADRTTRTRYNALSNLVQRRNTLQAQANKWRSYKDSDSGMVQPWAEKRAQVYEDQIRSVEDRMQSQFGDLLDEAAASDDGMITGQQKAMENRGLTRTPRPPAAGHAPAQSKGRVSRANFGKVRAQNPGLQGKTDAEVEAILRAQGIEVY